MKKVKEKKINVYLKKHNCVVCYGQLGKIIKSKERKQLTLREKTEIIVKELNDLLPTACVEQKTMYYFIREENC